MTIEVAFDLFGPIRDVVGKKRVTESFDDDVSIRDGFSALCDSFPELESHLGPDGSRTDGVTVTVDGRNIRQLDGIETTLTDGAVVRLAPPVVGG
ncbi:ubiquitin-like small modifier protein 1 [Haloferax sp. DFSO52]|uniref:ubiquitin-like small modifier protein 1 n=1 Tax=Haloferax sp. DFSO52 TaxID=3388505 RepID=UPI003A8C08F5